MFDFLRSKKASSSSGSASGGRPGQVHQDSWRSTGEGGESEYDDVNLEAGLSDSQLSNNASRTSFSAPRADAGSFVNNSSSFTLNEASASYPPQPSSSSRIAGTNGYPSLRSTFRRLEAVLTKASPTLLDTLAPPLLPQSPELASLLHAISPYHLPTAVIESYLLHDGQDQFASNQQGLIWGLHWLPLDQVEQEWRFWRRFELAGGEGGMKDAFSAHSAADDRDRGQGVGRIHPYTTEEQDDVAGLGMSGMSAFPPGWVRSRYSHPGWLPLLSDRAGNYIGVDLDPPPPSAFTGGSESAMSTFGQSGQVIAFGREIDEKVVLFPGDSAGGWGRFLAAFVDDLDRRDFARLAESEDGSPKPKQRSWGSESGPDDSGGNDDDRWEDGDGLGDADYVDGDRYGEEDDQRGQGKLWMLRTEYRRWLEAEDRQGGVIAALAERSRRQWRSVGVGIVAPSGRVPLSVVVPSETYNADDAGPESSVTERQPSPKPETPDAATEAVTASTSSLALDDNHVASDQHPLNTVASPTGSAVELQVSPASPTFPSSSSSTSNPRSPDRNGKRAEPRQVQRGASTSSHSSNGSSGGRLRILKRPPPPPGALDLPTMLDISEPLAEESSHTVQFAHYSGDRDSRSSPPGSARSSSYILDEQSSTPTRDDHHPLRSLAESEMGASRSVLVEGVEADDYVVPMESLERVRGDGTNAFNASTIVLDTYGNQYKNPKRGEFMPRKVEEVV